MVRPWSIGKCPTIDELRAAWANRHRSQKDFIWLLSILAELSCFTDYSLEHCGGFGNIAGRKGGLKAFLWGQASELACQYKSISRYVRLSYRLRQAFSIYPPAALSLLHPELPLPPRRMPFLTNHCRKVYREHLSDLPPQTRAFEKVIADRFAQGLASKHRWSSPLPREKWGEAERKWYKRYIKGKALKEIRSDHSFYSRDYWLE